MAEAEDRKKMPNIMKNVYAQILEHPGYPSLDSSMRFAFEGGCVGGGSWCTKQNNKWSREIWRHLYWGEPMKD